MNLRVAQHARLEETRLVMERRSARRRTERRSRVALQAEQIDVADFQHVRIRPAMRQMAGLASLDFHRGVFEHKRTLLVRMALEADGILRRRRAHLLGPGRAVRIVAVGALDEALVHPVMERHFKLRFLREVARVAQLRLRFYQKELRFRCVVRRMAGNAADVVL